MTIEELKEYLEKEIAYFQKLKANREMSDEGKIRLETFEYILNKING